MKRILLMSFFVVGLLVASEPGAASSAAEHVCPICLAPVDLTLPEDNPEAAMTSTPLFGCSHPEHFHAECLAGLLQTSGAQAQCPLCRQPLLAHPGPNLPAIIQAVLPAAPPAVAPPAVAPPAVAPLASVIAVWAPLAWIAAPAVLALHITSINRIMHHYDAAGQSLNLHSKNITTIDGVVFEQINKQLHNLKYLDLSNNRLAAVPPEIGLLVQLERLDLSNNPQLASLPAQIGQLTNLKYLDLSHNPLLAAVPLEIGDLRQLQGLYLSNNRLASLPPEIGQLTNLQYLDLSHNPLLAAVPPEIGKLARLEMLDLSHNPLLAAVPPEIGKLARLETLDLRGTPVVSGANWRAMHVQLQQNNPNLRIFE